MFVIITLKIEIARIKGLKKKLRKCFVLPHFYIRVKRQIFVFR